VGKQQKGTEVVLRQLWLRAQGVPESAIIFGDWKNRERFEVYPPRCVLCGRAWRPDRPNYIAVYGESYQTPIGLRWGSFPLRIYGVSTGVYGGSVRYLCREHGDKYREVADCVTGEAVKMLPRPTDAERAWQNVRYWVGSGIRFAYLCAQWGWGWVAYRVFGQRSLTCRAAWPPLKEIGGG